ncbi:MAG: glycosyltransferase family 9 protein [Fluviicola sp.]|jgi:heptosyltransferase-2|nr:glycosyltransferase family 9 protein [Fluviicola sp.]
MTLNEVKYDCKYFRTGIPCLPNKKENVTCDNCSYYKPIETRILIIKLGALGDVIRTTPLIERFRKEFPSVHFTWLTHSPAVLPSSEIEVIYKWDFTNVYTVQNTKYDIAINLDKDNEACMLLANVDSKIKYGYIWKDNHIAAATPKAEHKLLTGFFDGLSKENTKSYLEEIFEICHFDFQKEEYLINLNTSLSEEWSVRFKALANDKKIIGLNTGCGPRWNTRLWSDHNWEVLALELKNRGYFPVFLGGELEHEKNERMANATGCHYPGHFSLEEFMAITNSCDFIITQVSMMMHIATALKKKMVLCNTIFNKHEFELYGRGLIVEPPKPCECYFGNTCVRGNSCMHDIHPSDFVKAILTLDI